MLKLPCNIFDHMGLKVYLYIYVSIDAKCKEKFTEGNPSNHGF